MRSAVALFLFPVFAAAFLIFGVQPMVGKHILPWFGGVPSVWMTCLAFYQTALFLGYAYAYGLVAGVRPRLQPVVHAVLFLASLGLLPALPAEAWKPISHSGSTLRILAMLGASVGLPFLLLAATGPLLQVWFARALPGRSPYPLYAVSNLGSLLGLLSYPFLVEPNLGLTLQSTLWSVCFAATGLWVISCAVRAARAAPDAVLPRSAAVEPLARGDVLLWILFPASAVVMFMGVTNQLTLDVASVPFLWILPLSLYLLTLVIAFASMRLYRRRIFVTLAAASVVWVLAAGSGVFGDALGGIFTDSLGVTALRYSVALFAGCMVAHGELSRVRPAPARLTSFYLCVAGGGAIGGLFVGLAAPQLFAGYLELPLGAAVCWVLALVAIHRTPSGVFMVRHRGVAWTGVAVLSLGVAGAFAFQLGRPEPGLLTLERNFFGVLRVIETASTTPFVVLRHGSTRHGIQYRDESLRKHPTSYYGRTTGIGLLMTQETSAGAGPLRVGVVGLGVGTLAAYGRAQDEMVFYEIDPAVVRIARDDGYFSYLADSPAQIEIVLGDARLSLEAERAEPRNFDALILDAFSSDAVPLHLLTAQAFELYAAHLAKGGFLAIHISNRSFDLSGPVARLGQEVGLHALHIVNRNAPRLLAEEAHWMVLARDPGRLERLATGAARLPRRQGQPLTRATLVPPEVAARSPLWTDDFSNLLALLRERGRRGIGAGR